MIHLIAPVPSSELWLQASASTPSPKEKVDRFEQEMNAEANRLPKAKQATFKAMIRSAVDQMLVCIAGMKAQGKSIYAIIQKIDGQIQAFHPSKTRFFEQNGIYESNKVLVQNRNQAIRNKILEARFRPVVLQKEPSDASIQAEPRNYAQEELDRAQAYCLARAKELPQDKRQGYRELIRTETSQIRKDIFAELKGVAPDQFLPMIRGRIDEMKFSAQLYHSRTQQRTAKTLCATANIINTLSFPSLLDDGSIKPYSRYLLTTASPTLWDVLAQLGKKLMGSPREVEKKRALVLTANVDNNQYFTLSLFGYEKKTETFHRLERDYKMNYRKVSDITTFCKAIDKETDRGGPIDLLIIRAHGTRNSMALDEHRELRVGDRLPAHSCLRRLAPKATIILEACETGRNKEQGNNLANYLIRYTPPGTRIISPTEVVTRLVVVRNVPIEVRFINESNHRSDLTYVIDERNREETVDSSWKLISHDYITRLREDNK